MKSLKIFLTTSLLSVALTGAAVAQEATSLNQLLDQVRQGAANDQREARERLEIFQRDQANQQRLLQQARSERTALERRGEELEALFDQNNQQIATATQELNERLGALKELFGVLQQVSGDTQSVFKASLTNVQYPDREQFLIELGNKMASTTSLASIEDIETLWYELQREMTETGKIAKFTADVTDNEGQTASTEVVRVGAFNIVTDGKYLQYSASTGNVAELPRQPTQGRFTGSTAALAGAGAGEIVRFGVDPTRGGILAQLVDTPTLRERVDQGGVVGYCIIGLGILGLLIAVFLFFSLTAASSKVSAQLKDTSNPKTNNPLGRVLATYDANRSVDTETVELKLSEAVLKETPALTRGLLFLKVIAAVAPLAGLLGTVTGMIKTFQVITLYGAGDPKLMAGGISQALMTTVLGLVVAIPMILLHTYLNGRSRRVLSILQEQSAGMIAEHSEKSHH
ncbi:MAG: MotA/TolQ/ExbB proton channel family protein [Pseudomonadota bacterium]